MKKQWALVPVIVIGAVGIALWGGAHAATSATTSATTPATTSATTSATTPASGVSTTILATSHFDALKLEASAHLPGPWQLQLETQGRSDAYVVDNTFAPGSDTGWHSHPGPSLVMVVSGTVTNYSSDDPACLPHVYGKGSSFVDAGGSDTHILRNEGAVPAETIAVQLLPAGAPRKTSEPVPANCVKK